MKFFIKVMLFISMSFPIAYINAFGGTGTHGGDPRVADVLDIADKVCGWFDSNEKYQKFADACGVELNDLSDSVNVFGREPRIKFSDEEALDSTGTPKDLTTNLDKRTMAGNIDRWDRDDLTMKTMTVVMELCLLLEIPNRYDVAKEYLRWTKSEPMVKKPVSVHYFKFPSERPFPNGEFEDQYKGFLTLNLGNDELLRFVCNANAQPPSMQWALEVHENFHLKTIASGTETFARKKRCLHELKSIYHNIVKVEASRQRSKALGRGPEWTEREIPIKFIVDPGYRLKTVYGSWAIETPFLDWSSPD